MNLTSTAPTTVSTRKNRSVAALSDPSLPVNDGGVVKNSSATLNDTDARKFATTVNAAMTDNANFPDVTPALDVMDAAVADLQAMDEAVRLAKVALAEAYAQRAASRATLDSLVKARASYVQLASNGNTSVILSSGFPVRSARTPVGLLDAPVNLSINLNGSPGVMFLSWDVVPNSRAYNIQVSPAESMVRNWAPLRTSTATKLQLTGMTLGSIYAFRIAAVGGSSGQSDWSAEAVRMAA